MKLPQRGNLFGGIPASFSAELAERLAGDGTARIERIVSRGHISPPGFWYDQELSEWVMVVKGRAALAFADANDLLQMNAGDYITIPAHCRHRVA